jgi:uncharacterized iron-regulated membrane protein
MTVHMICCSWIRPAGQSSIRALARQGAGAQLATSVFALHSGSYFGMPGRVVVMLSSLGMSLFFITGWMLYLDRRRSQRAARAAPVAAGCHR